jgi:hypothetical protein
MIAAMIGLLIPALTRFHPATGESLELVWSRADAPGRHYLAAARSAAGKVDRERAERMFAIERCPDRHGTGRARVR